jgi:hypothetical protein
MLGAGSGGEGVDGLAGGRSGNHWMLMVVSVVRAGRLSHRYLAPRRTAARDLRSCVHRHRLVKSTTNTHHT